MLLFGTFVTSDGVVHEVDDVDDAAPNVVLDSVGLLLFPYDLEERLLDPVGNAGTC